jgi:hypothetical protein
MVTVAPGGERDAALAAFVRTVVDAAQRSWGTRIIAEGDGTFDPRQLYTETHYALGAVLLFLHDRGEPSLLDLAEARLRLWGTGTYPLTFFNAMAICLTRIVLARSGVRHQGLEAILGELIGQTREHRGVAYRQWCGNNAYLQQVAVDTVLLPIACGRAVTADATKLLATEFEAFRTAEGLFYDLPRQRGQREPLLPPTYIMKMLFLAGVCHELHPAPEFERLFREGMDAVLPLISRDGTFSYLGRTDNSPFAAGLTIFNLRKAARLSPVRSDAFDEACGRVERFLASFPRTDSGVLESNRFADAANPAEARRSKDAYAYVAQYSLSGCTYALLGSHWFPSPNGRAFARPGGASQPSVASSQDLGVVKLDACDRELIVRTRSEITAWDRRYLGPTILRYSSGPRLLVGAISRSVATDSAIRQRARGGVRGLLDLFRNRYVEGAEHLDATSVGFVPVLRRGAVDYIPGPAELVDTSPATVLSRHAFQGVHARGVHPCVLEALQLAHRKLPGLKPREYAAPRIVRAPSLALSRVIAFEAGGCTIDDTLTGPLAGKRLLFSIRRMPGTAVRVSGMTKTRTFTGWGSDGRQQLDVYEAAPAGSSFTYRCNITEAP